MDSNTNNGIERAAEPQLWTGGQKAGWFFVGLLMGIPGVIIASLCNANHPDRSTATKMALIGMFTLLALSVLVFSMAACTLTALVTSVAGTYY